jgi:hypothetical protein
MVLLKEGLGWGSNIPKGCHADIDKYEMSFSQDVIKFKILLINQSIDSNYVIRIIIV